jgi:hypothetical protein
MPVIDQARDLRHHHRAQSLELAGELAAGDIEKPGEEDDREGRDDRQPKAAPSSKAAKTIPPMISSSGCASIQVSATATTIPIHTAARWNSRLVAGLVKSDGPGASRGGRAMLSAPPVGGEG